MNFPIHIDTISMGLSNVYFKGTQVDAWALMYIHGVFRSPKVVLIIANSVDPDEMQHHAEFHLHFH